MLKVLFKYIVKKFEEMARLVKSLEEKPWER